MIKDKINVLLIKHCKNINDILSIYDEELKHKQKIILKLCKIIRRNKK